MRAVGMSHDEIAVEFARRYKLRPRAAHRHARGWTQTQAANHINAHAARTGLDPDGAAPMTGPKLSELENWPLPSNRRRPTPQLLALLAAVYGTSIHNLIDLDDREHLTPADLLLINRIDRTGPDHARDLPAPPATLPGSEFSQPGSLVVRTELPADLGMPLPISSVWPPVIETLGPTVAVESFPAPRTVEQLLQGASKESADVLYAIDAAPVSALTLEQIDADIRRIVNLYSQRPALPTFLEVRALRARVFPLLTVRQRPDLSRDLCYRAGLLSGVLANAAFDLGSLDSAQTHARVAFACADQAGHNGLRAWIRGTQSMLAYWDDQPGDAVKLAQDGWRYQPERGTAKVRLAALEARALARMGDSHETPAALGRVAEARDRVTLDDDPGGMLAFPLAKQLYYASSASLWLTPTRTSLQTAERDAATAVALLEALPEGERRVGEESLAHTDVALARILSGDLEGAVSEVRVVIQMSSIRRVESAMRRLAQVLTVLERPTYRGQTLAGELRDQIRSQTVVRSQPAAADLSATTGYGRPVS
ncbi:hypothetical protein [Frankia sp. R43]|uniref:hypothetical protein n=1 Tax=Frankia sp. R43 TaxID=269536 RepID=UPI001F447BE8|nr:hypothetical protein [Frankia sp. R43]